MNTCPNCGQELRLITRYVGGKGYRSAWECVTFWPTPALEIESCAEGNPAPRWVRVEIAAGRWNGAAVLAEALRTARLANVA